MAAGKGTRLRPLTDSTPKPLIPVNGSGTLLRLLHILPRSVDHLIIIIGYLGDQIRAAVGDTWNGINVTYVYQDPLNGTGGALRQAQSVIHGEHFLVCNGDDLYAAADLERLAQMPKSLLGYQTMTTASVDALVVRDGRLNGFEHVSAGVEALVNIGAYHVTRAWFDGDPVLAPGKTDEWGLPQGIVAMLDRESYQVIPASFWLPCGTPDELKKARETVTELIDLPK